MLTSFLFWNINERPLQALVAALAAQHDVDVVILAECDLDPEDVLNAFAAAGITGFTYPSSPADGDIKIFGRFARSVLQPIYDDVNNHVTIRRLRLVGTREVLLAVVHSQSKVNWSDADQAQGAIRLARRIQQFETQQGHKRTILVGDLNMNPFEVGVVGSEGLHAVMTKHIARLGGRTVDAEHRTFFYNPMWQFFGDRGTGPPGTHYFSAAGKPVAFFWNIYDQVLVRPALIDQLRDVKILADAGGATLLDGSGRPDPAVGSDHLPLLFNLDL